MTSLLDILWSTGKLETPGANAIRISFAHSNRFRNDDSEMERECDPTGNDDDAIFNLDNQRMMQLKLKLFVL